MITMMMEIVILMTIVIAIMLMLLIIMVANPPDSRLDSDCLVALCSRFACGLAGGLLRALGADALQQHRRGLVVGILRHELAGEGHAQNGAA